MFEHFCHRRVHILCSKIVAFEVLLTFFAGSRIVRFPRKVELWGIYYIIKDNFFEDLRGGA